MNDKHSGSGIEYNVQNILAEKHTELEKGNILTGMPTGFKDLDNLLNGLQDENLIVIGGKSIGKTSFALNIAQNVSIKTQTNVIYFSLATDKIKIVNRLIAATGNVSLDRIQRNSLSDKDWRKVSFSFGLLQKSNLFIIDDAVLGVREIAEKVEEITEQTSEKSKLIIIDYLSLLQADGEQNRYEQTDSIVKQLKILSRSLHSPIILAVNLSRSFERRMDKGDSHTKPRLSDLRDSGTIEEDSDVIMFLSQDNFYSKNQDSEVSGEIIEIIVAKNRNGRTGTIRLGYYKDYSKFVCLSGFVDENK